MPNPYLSRVCSLAGHWKPRGASGRYPSLVVPTRASLRDGRDAGISLADGTAAAASSAALHPSPLARSLVSSRSLSSTYCVPAIPSSLTAPPSVRVRKGAYVIPPQRTPHIRATVYARPGSRACGQESFAGLPLLNNRFEDVAHGVYTRTVRLICRGKGVGVRQY